MVSKVKGLFSSGSELLSVTSALPSGGVPVLAIELTVIAGAGTPPLTV